MMSSRASKIVFLLLSSASTSLASPMHLNKRALSTGAKAGLGIGIAVVVILVGLLITFFIVHFRRQRHLATVNKERAILAGEKNPDGSDKPDKFAPAPSGMPRRNKSVKDRLMGPLYRGSTIDLASMPPKAHLGNRSSTMTQEGIDGLPMLHKPWNNSTENSPRPSFSSKRATRMMMMM